MGDWNETCGITRLHINAEQKVVMVLLKEEKFNAQYLVDNMMFFEKHIIGIYEGEYDGYGWINGLKETKDMGKEPHLRTIFFHRKAWNFVLNEISNDDSEGIDNIYSKGYIDSVLPFNIKLFKKFEDLFTDFLKVFYYGKTCRINIFSGIVFKGSQSENHTYIPVLNPLIKELSTDLKNYYD